MKSTDSVIVSWDFSRGKDVGVFNCWQSEKRASGCHQCLSRKGSIRALSKTYHSEERSGQVSFQYDQYLTQHRSNVKRGFDWIAENLPELLVDGFDYGWQIEFAHDKSKDEQDEYEAYDAYFYGGNRSYAVMQNYQKAWLLHLHRNPHHWQYWILINDDPEEGEIILEMPYNYIIEMICDWWAFSWQKGKLDEIFGWYDEHCKYMKLHPKTRKTIEDILEKMKTKLDEIKEKNELQNQTYFGSDSF